jgi:excisionase family DNA binding protein
MGMWSVKEAAQGMGISERYLRDLLESGQIEGKKLGHDWVVLSLEYKRKRKPKGWQSSEKS